MSFTSLHLYFDDIELHQEWESVGRTVTEADVVQFAGVSGDFNAIHMDHAYASTTPFRRPIAHGLLGLAFASGLGLYAPPVRTLAFLQIKEWHFLDPVFFGDTLRLRTKVLEKESRGRGRRGVVTWHRELVNQDQKSVQRGVTVTLVEGRAAAKIKSDDSPA